MRGRRKQGQLSARAGVCDPLQKGTAKIDPHHRMNEPHVVTLAAVRQGGEKGIKGNRHSCAQGIWQADRSGSGAWGAPAAEGVSDRTWTG